MTTNLLTGYMQNLNRPSVQSKKQSGDVEIVNVKKHKPDFDINRELANRTFIKPLPAKAHIVKSRIFDAPAIFVKDAVYDIKSLKDGWMGKANDHQLGKLNDLGMKIGGLAIASYLFTKRQTPTTKAMEFIGFASFFASMSLWPKIALQLPARLIHGFNVMPEYEDSFGRKKPFYQDNLFIPWDVYSDEEINKIGNRLGVPRDIPNRRDYIQEKMRKIALQNNTMWMLTAGVATPVMAALICNSLEKPVTKLFDKYYSKKADKLLRKFTDASENARNNKIINAVDNLIELNSGSIIDKKLIKSFAMALGANRDMITVAAIEKDLTNIFLNDGQKFTIPKEIIPNIVKSSKDALTDKFDRAVIDAIIPNEQQLLERLENSKALNSDEFQKKIMGNLLTKDEIVKVSLDYDNLIRENIRKYNSTNPQKILRADAEIPVILKRLHGKSLEEGPVMKALLAAPETRLDINAQNFLRYLSDTMTDFSAQGKVLDKYVSLKFGKTSNLANYWNEVDSAVLKLLNFTDKELALIKDDRMLVTPMLMDKLEDIAADKAAYEKVLGGLCDKLAKIGETIKGGTVSDEYKTLCNDVFEAAADKLRNFQIDGRNYKMSNLVKELVGYDELARDSKLDENISIKAFAQRELQKLYPENRLLSVKSSFERIINTLDFFRRTATLENMKLPKIPIEEMEELINAAKAIQLDAHMADYETKFYVLRNPNPADKDVSLLLKDGKLVYQFINKGNVKKVDIPDDPVFFHHLIELMYGKEMHPETLDILTRHNYLGMKEYREAMMRDVGDVDYFAKRYHKLFTPYEEGSKATSENKFNRIGKSFTDLIYDVANRKYNTSRWLKIFVPVGIGLLGITVLSQFFFGKLSLPESRKTKKG